MRVEIATFFLSSKHFKISSVNFNRACSVLAHELKPNCDDNIVGEVVTEFTIKYFFINFTVDWQNGCWPVAVTWSFLGVCSFTVPRQG